MMSVVQWLCVAICILFVNARHTNFYPEHLTIPSLNFSFYSDDTPLITTLNLVYASPSGSYDTNSCGSENNPCSLPAATNITASSGTILLLNGTYTNVCSLAITRSMNITAQYAGNAIIDCEYKAQAFIVFNGLYVSFYGITIKHGMKECGSAIMSPYATISVDSCSFVNNIASSSSVAFAAAIVSFEDITITNSIFINNTAYGSTPGAIAYGAAIYAALTSTSSEITIINSTFDSNYAAGADGVGTSICGYALGGAVIVYVASDHSTVNIIGCTFHNNVAKGGDCDMVIAFMQLRTNQKMLSGQADGGAIDIGVKATDCTIVIDSCEFSGNQVISGSESSIAGTAYGGAVTFGIYQGLYAGNNLSVTNSVFDNNSVTGGWSGVSITTFGGAMAIVDSENLIISNCAFTKNSVTAGDATTSAGTASAGAVKIQNTQVPLNALIMDTVFSDNTVVGGSSSTGSPSDAFGGAITLSASTQSQAQFKNVEFRRNVAVGGSTQTKSVGGAAHGGACSLTYISSVLFDNCTYDSNVAIGGAGIIGGPSQGGAVIQMAATDCLFSNCSFSNNAAYGGNGSSLYFAGFGGVAYGGALYVGSRTAVVDSVFSGNVAQGGQGASAFSVVDLQGQDGGFGGNAFGGSIYSVTGIQLNISSCQFYDNGAAGGEGGAPSEHGFPSGSPGASGKAYGGAVGADYLIMTNTIFENNLAGDHQAHTSQSVGGAIGAGTVLVASQTSFRDNHAIATGQALGGAVLTGTMTSLQNVSFELNSIQLPQGSGYGGALYAPPPPSSGTNNASFIAMGPVRMYNNSVSGQVSLGGAVFVNNTEQVVIDSADMENNTAQYGGGLYIFSEPTQSYNNQTVNMQDTKFVENFAKFGGGAIFVSSDILQELSTTNLAFQNNTALYGNTTASDVTTLSFAKSPPTTVWPGQLFSLELVLLDALQNSVIQPNLTVSVKSNSNSFFSGVSQDTSLINMDTGKFVFAASAIVSNTGSQCSLYFYSTSPSSLDVVSQFNTSLTIYVTECPPSTFLQGSSFGYTCDACQPDEYNMDGKKCHKCPKPAGTNKDDTAVCVNLNVTSRHLVVKEGYYPHPSFYNPSRLLACPYSKACKEFTCSLTPDGTELDVSCNTVKSDSDTCTDGYEDRLCSKCVCNSHECYFMTNDMSCEQCQASNRDQWIENQFYLINGLFAMGVIYLLVTKAIPPALVRGLWFYIQSTLTLLVPDAWPKWLYQVEGYLPFVSSLQIYSLQCILPSSWSNPIPQFLIAMVSPFLLTAAALLGFLALRFFHWLDGKFGIRQKVLKYVSCLSCLLPTPTSSSHHHKKSLTYLCVRSFLMVLNLTYFSLAVSILTVLQPCDSYEYMPQYPWISCDSTEYHTLISLATAFALFYIFGVPVLFGALLIVYRHEIRDLKKQRHTFSSLISEPNDDYDVDPSSSSKELSRQLLDFSGASAVSTPHAPSLKLIEFLYQSYTADAYWFEILWISRKLMIAIALHVIPATLGQVTMITMVLAFGIVVQNWIQPYQKEYHYINTVEIFSSGVLILTLNIGYHIKEFGSGTTKEGVQSLMVIMNAALLLGIIGVMVFQLVTFRKRKQLKALSTNGWLTSESDKD